MNGVVYNTFEEACFARDIITGNQFRVEWISESLVTQMLKQLRSMFSYMLAFRNVNDLLKIWEGFCDNFCEDFIHCRLGRDAPYLKDLRDILSVLR